MTAGPFETEADARAAAQLATGSPDSRAAVSPAANLALLGGALEEAGVEMGAYDDRIARWMCEWEPAVVAVVAGWVQRAHKAGAGDGSKGTPGA